MLRFIGMASLALLLGLSSAATAAPAKVVIRFATLAPSGSPWDNVLQRVRRVIEKKTAGEVTMKIFAGTTGDDTAMNRKIRLGQLDAAGMTGVGLGEHVPESRIFEVPFLFASPKQQQCVRAKLEADLIKKFDQKGFVFIGWADVGSVYLFSKKPIAKVADLSGTKPWVWKSDPVGIATFAAFNINGTQLQIQDVKQSLQTGLVDTVYNTPMALTALQWEEHLEHVIDVAVSNAIGAVIVTKTLWAQLNPEQQKIVAESTKGFLDALAKLTVRDNKKSLDGMVEEGLNRVPPDKAALQDFQTKGRVIAKALVGKLYDQSYLDLVLRYMGECK